MIDEIGEEMCMPPMDDKAGETSDQNSEGSTEIQECLQNEGEQRTSEKPFTPANVPYTEWDTETYDKSSVAEKEPSIKLTVETEQITRVEQLSESCAWPRGGSMNNLGEAAKRSGRRFLVAKRRKAGKKLHEKSRKYALNRIAECSS